MDIVHNPKLTASELAYLWGVNLTDGMHVYIFQYFLKHVEDPNTETLLQHALDLCQQHVEIIKNLCHQRKSEIISCAGKN